MALSPVVGVSWLLTVGVNPATMTLCKAGHLIKKGEECEFCEQTAKVEESAKAKIKVMKEKGTALCKACGQRFTIGDERCEWCGFPTQRDVEWHMIPPA
jgi:ribosomal protein L37E